MTRPSVGLFVAVLLATSSAQAQPPPKAEAKKGVQLKLREGTRISVPPEGKGEREIITLDVTQFLVTRDDLDYYNALQLRYDALLVSNQDCEKQVSTLRQRPPEQPSFWGTPLGLSLVAVGAVAVGTAVGFGLAQ